MTSTASTISASRKAFFTSATKNTNFPGTTTSSGSSSATYNKALLHGNGEEITASSPPKSSILQTKKTSPPSMQRTISNGGKTEDSTKLVKYVDEQIVGKTNSFLGPFGRRKVVYCDYTASGRSLHFIEDYILREVLSNYGNSYTTSTVTSMQLSHFRNEARELVKSAVNGCEDDVLLFTGHGCSDALNKLIHVLDLREAPVIFTGCTEHHDNIHQWQEIGATIVRIGEISDGTLDLHELESQLQMHHNCSNQHQLIGCFSAASSVTGIIINDVACTKLLHQYGALAFWDYNVAAPYIHIDMNPATAQKDAIYFAGHKFIGGVQTPGILIAKRRLFRRVHACSEADGFFTSKEYYKDFEMAEEGRCVPVIESIRAGLVVQLREAVTITQIAQRHDKINKQMLQHIRTIPEIILLGNTAPTLKRLPIFSFMVRHPRGTFLHHNFVCAILNDVFGVQARAGCPCAGAYAQELLGIDQSLANQYETILLEDRRLSSLNLGQRQSTLQLLRPGFTRISLPYFVSDTELAFIMEAVKMVATEGWRLLPQYHVDLETGEWRHWTNAVLKERRTIHSIRYQDGRMNEAQQQQRRPSLSSTGIVVPTTCVHPQTYSECLQAARNLFNRSRKTANRTTTLLFNPSHLQHLPQQQDSITFDSRGEKLRWFMLPTEAQNLLTSNAQCVKQKVPFEPVSYLSSRKSGANTTKPMATSSPCHYSVPSSSFDDTHLTLRSCSSPIPWIYYQQPTATTTIQQPASLSFSAPLLTPATQAIQAPVPHVDVARLRQRHLSYNECLDMEPASSSPTHSLNNYHYQLATGAGGFAGRNSPDLQTYVTEMTRELATNIKSEIREVINKVEDVLENTDSNTNSGADVKTRQPHHLTSSTSCCFTAPGGQSQQQQQQQQQFVGSGSSEDGKSDSISANEVAEYIGKVSIEMANEVKSEIRDMVSAVDVYITPDSGCGMFTRSASIGERTGTSTVYGGSDRLRGRRSGGGRKSSNKASVYTPGSSSETVIHLINTTTSNSSDEDVTPMDEKQFKNKIQQSTVASVSSQDSGINLSFHEPAPNNTDYDFCKPAINLRSQSETVHHPHQDMVEDVEKQPKTGDDISLATAHYRSLPNSIWQPTIEAIDEFDMIRHGDRVMVCLSGGKDSLSLLHMLLQYQNSVLASSRCLLFTLGAITIDPEITSGCDTCTLITHLKDLGVHYIVDGQKTEVNQELTDDKHSIVKENLYSFTTARIRHKLYAAAKSAGYNVLAIGQHLDDLCENFLLSAFHTGRLRTMRAHYFIREHKLRVIRPFVYVRDKYLRQFVNSENLPVLQSLMLQTASDAQMPIKCITKERQRIKQVLTQQDILFPKLFTSLKTALHSLIGFEIKECELGKYRKRLQSKESIAGKDEGSKTTTATTWSKDNETDEEPVD